MFLVHNFFLLLGPTPIVTTQEKECLDHLKEADYLLIMAVYWSVRSSDEVANHGLHLGKCRNTFVKDEKKCQTIYSNIAKNIFCETLYSLSAKSFGISTTAV